MIFWDFSLLIYGIVRLDLMISKVFSISTNLWFQEKQRSCSTMQWKEMLGSCFPYSSALSLVWKGQPSLSETVSVQRGKAVFWEARNSVEFSFIPLQINDPCGSQSTAQMHYPEDSQGNATFGQAAPYAEWEAPIHTTRTNFLKAPQSH